VVLGGGAAGAYAVEALREAGFTGRVVLITQEHNLPYDRPNCSKDYLQGEVEEAWMPLRSEAFYAERAIEVMQGRRVVRADAEAKTLRFEDGEALSYDTLILCTGCTPRRLDVPGTDLDGVMILRSYADSNVLREAAQHSTRAVMVGASFIGMEVAYSLRKLGLDVTVVESEPVPFARTLGQQVGKRLQAEHETHGVRFYLDSTVRALEGEQAVERVVLKDGTVLDAELVVIGIGVEPATDFLHGLERATDGSVVVDASLYAGAEVYAAGDIAQFPDWRSGEPVRIEHWRLACQHGRLAGYNAAGRSLTYRSVPYFWTVQFDINLHYVGHATKWDDIIYDGDPQGEQFMAYYIRADTVRAVVGINRSRDLAAIHELMRRELLPVPEVLRQGSFDPVALLREAGGEQASYGRC
jgi:NADPH-dependent 2,4-dienoyl-CoA reductase/sulfur reductase-like enzyme